MRKNLKNGLLNIVGAIALTASPVAYSEEDPIYQEFKKELDEAERQYNRILDKIELNEMHRDLIKRRNERENKYKDENEKKARPIKLVVRYVKS